MRFVGQPLLLGMLACAPDKGETSTGYGDGSGFDESTAGNIAYDIDHLMEVEIELDPDDWDELRYQERNLVNLLSGEECLDEAWESPFTWFVGTATIDGEVFEQVEFRKKGLLGSVVSDRPSLKLDFDDHVEDQMFDGLERLTLNNGNQDGTRIVPCLGYALYADAGLPASRCSYAHVVVNGDDLGVYANVEPIKDPFLRRNFGNDGGNLYEGTLSDFRDGWSGSFDDKTEEGDFSDIDEIVAALELDEDEVLDALDELINLDQFIDAWAMEVMIGHWDSYTGNANNFYFYRDEEDDRYQFIPWGIDAILMGDEPFGEGLPVSIVGNTSLPATLANIPETRERFHDAQDLLLEQVWDEEVLESRLDDAIALTEDAAWPNDDDEGWYSYALRLTRRFIWNRRDHIEEERAEEEPEIDADLDESPCLVSAGTVSLDFETTWGSYPDGEFLSTGSGEFEITYDGDDIPVDFLSAVVGEDGGYTVLFIIGELSDGGGNVGIYSYGEGTEMFDEAGQIQMGAELWAYLLYDDGGFDNWQTWAWLGGTMELSAAGTSDDDVVEGWMELDIYE